MLLALDLPSSLFAQPIGQFAIHVEFRSRRFDSGPIGGQPFGFLAQPLLLLPPATALVGRNLRTEPLLANAGAASAES